MNLPLEETRSGRSFFLGRLIARHVQSCLCRRSHAGSEWMEIISHIPIVVLVSQDCKVATSAWPIWMVHRFNHNLFADFLLALFAFVNPLYTVPVFLGMTQDFSDAERWRTSATAAATMFCALILTALVGDQILLVLGINVPSFKIAGGLIILVLAFQMLFVDKDKVEEQVPAA